MSVIGQASGSVATDTLIDAAGDLIVGTADNTAGRLAKGTALQVLRVNAGETALEYATPASGGAAVANPGGGAQVDLTGANGSAATALRSDSTLVLSQSITPTWTAQHINSYAGTASTPALKFTGLPFAGTGTTSFGLLHIAVPSATASTTQSTAGTCLVINNHGTSDMFNVMQDGVTAFKLNPTNVCLITGKGTDGTTYPLKVVYGASGFQGLRVLDNGFCQLGACGLTSTSQDSGVDIHGTVLIAESGTRLAASGSYIGGATINFRPNGGSVSFTVTTASGLIQVPGTTTAGGTTGAQTINKPCGVVNFAAGASTLVVTNSLASATTPIFAQVLGTDATAVSVRVTRASGSFTLTLPATATAETAVEFFLFGTPL